ncbi:MAG: J domain-containing protein [Chlorobiaceae bacterium]|nr:J domain-containing protein [Chlorobiaceae bacterium]
MKAHLSHYDNLGVSQSAPDEVIKAAYRTLSKIHHPDLNPGSTDAAGRMKSINESYDILCNPLKRKLYDEWLRLQEQAVSAKPENHAEPAVWPARPAPARISGTWSFRMKFILATGLLFVTLVLAVVFSDPLVQYITDYRLPAPRPVTKSANPAMVIKEPPVVNSGSTSIPGGFVKDDIAGLFAGELSAFAPKDEFEKIGAYKARFNASAFHKPFFFFSGLARVSAYDIDRQVISITFTDGAELGSSKPVIVESRKESIPADNSRTVIPEITNYYLKDIREHPDYARYLASALNFRIGPDEGRDLKKHLGVMIIATPEADDNGIVVSESHSNEYEIFYQLNRKVTSRYVNAIINSIWVYNTETGAVQYKKSFPELSRKEMNSLFKKQSKDRKPGRISAKGDEKKLNLDALSPWDTEDSFMK